MKLEPRNAWLIITWKLEKGASLALSRGNKIGVPTSLKPPLSGKLFNGQINKLHMQMRESVCQIEFVLIYFHVVQFKVICVVLLWFGLRDSGKAFFSTEKQTQA